MIAAERAFAAHAVQYGTKDAFLKFMDSTAIVFEKGKPVSALEVWSSKPNSTGILDWHPTLAGISSGGDFGYSTGPWTFRNAVNDTVLARGHFISVWHLDKKGEWKFIVDIGVSRSPEEKSGSVQSILPVGFENGGLASLLEADSLFNESIRKNESQQDQISTSVVFKRTGRAEQRGGARPFPPDIQFSRLGWGMAPAGDLAFVYGTARLEQQTDNYIRIWRREGKSWKLVLEGLRV